MDGFTQKTEESHVSNVIDLLLNLAYFVYLGTVIPWEQYNSPALGVTPWRLVVIALFVIFFRRIPIMMALKPLIPDIKTWREALFAGHFGPIGVGAIFVAILARAETGGLGVQRRWHRFPMPASPIITSWLSFGRSRPFLSFPPSLYMDLLLRFSHLDGISTR